MKLLQNSKVYIHWQIFDRFNGQCDLLLTADSENKKKFWQVKHLSLTAGWSLSLQPVSDCRRLQQLCQESFRQDIAVYWYWHVQLNMTCFIKNINWVGCMEQKRDKSLIVYLPEQLEVHICVFSVTAFRVLYMEKWIHKCIFNQLAKQKKWRKTDQ